MWWAKNRKLEGVNKETALETFKSNLEAALPLLKAAGVVGLIEPINPYSVPNYNMDSYEDAVQLVKELDSPWVRLQLDVFHLQQIKGNITRNIKDLLPIVGHVQVISGWWTELDIGDMFSFKIAQVPGRGEPDSAGEVNFKHVLDTLESLSYQVMKFLHGLVNIASVKGAPTKFLKSGLDLEICIFSMTLIKKDIDDVPHIWIMDIYENWWKRVNVNVFMLNQNEGDIMG